MKPYLAHFSAEWIREHLESLVDSDVEYDEEEARENEEFMMDGVHALISAMKEKNALFKQIYQDVVPSGSYYEGLRITKADEFDLQIRVHLPFKKESLRISLPHIDSSFVTCQLTEEPQHLLCSQDKMQYPYCEVIKFFDNQRYLLADTMLTWFHNLIEETMESDEFFVPDTIHAMMRKPQGNGCPAFTMQITGGYPSRTIDVDLVLSVSTCCSKMPTEMYQSSRFRQLLKDEECLQWNLVPKPPKDRFASDPQAHELWRSAFTDIERKLLNNTGCLKKMIKLFKLLRDRHEDWRKPIVSYYIKTFLLLQFDRNPDLSYWSDDNIGTVFLDMLEAFYEAVLRGFIPYYFNRQANLLSNVNTICIINLRVCELLYYLKKNPVNLPWVFNYFPPDSAPSLLDEAPLYKNTLEELLEEDNDRSGLQASCRDTLGGCCIL